MAERGQRGSKRPSDQDRVARLQQKFAKMGDNGKSRPGVSASAPMSRVPSDPFVAWATRSGEKQPPLAEQTVRGSLEDSRPRDPSAAIIGAELVRRKSSVQRAVVTKFNDHLTSDVAESSRRSDHIQASEDQINKLVEVRYPG